MRQAKDHDKEEYSILVVDDSADFRSLLGMYLKEVPCSITEAGDGEDAVDLFKDSMYDLVIMDIIMPLMDGVDAIAAIRGMEAQRRSGRTPVVALTAEDSVDTGVDCLQAGADRILLKPVSRMGVVKTVCELLGIESPYK